MRQRRVWEERIRIKENEVLGEKEWNMGRGGEGGKKKGKRNLE